jgi:general secretion pathway protein F
MVEAGGRGGRLGEALEQLADHLEREESLRGQVTSALIYPALMAVAGGAAIAVLTLYVLPRFVLLLEDVGAGLPMSTAMLMATGDILARHWLSMGLAVAAAVGVVATYRRTPSGRVAVDRLLTRLPVLGPIRRNLAAARLGRTLESLLGAGLPLVQALDVAAGTLTDAGAAEDVARAREDVVTGSSLAAALGRAAAFPFLFLQIVELGEESGRLQDMLARGADVAEEQLERSLTRMVRLVEPTLIVGFGIVAGFVALSLLQAIYGMRIEGFTP